MAANANRAFRYQTLFTGLFPADVVSQPVLKCDQRVGNDLFVGSIDLRLRSRQKKVVPAREERIEIFLRLKVEALEATKLIKELPPDDKDVFVRRIHRQTSGELSF